ncbi:MAG: CPBP family intramembrane metalloprotease [Desulfobacterales bacterium]|nr:CPBP family intramembrane metalloprotease [Desulfobacterales bacterium]
MQNKKYFPVSGFFIVSIWLMPFFYIPGLDYVVNLLDEGIEWYWFDLLFFYYIQMSWLLILFGLVLFYRVEWHLMFSRINTIDILPALKLTIFVFLLSIALEYIIFYPVSFFQPEFVTNWYIDIPPAVYGANGQYPIIPNILSFLSLVVLAPVIEEFAFRGILLHRWSDTLGINKAIIFSSVLFGIVHTEPIGATIFSVAMCFLYLKTRTLWIPIMCHALNNLAAWIIEAGYSVKLGTEYIYTLEDFQNEWLVGFSCFLIVIIWTYIYLKSPRSQKALRLPDVS